MTSVRLALQALAANKMRTALTMLGTIIGVCCVVALWNIGESGRNYMSDIISSLGPNMIFVQANYNADEEDQRRNRYRPLTLAEDRYRLSNGKPLPIPTVAGGTCGRSITEMRKQVSPPDALDNIFITSRTGSLAVRPLVMSHVYPCMAFPSSSWASARSDAGSLPGPLLPARRK